jgi:superfamily II DNA or RNA helicase
MLGAETILEIAQLTNAYYTYALTATPFREDGKDICIEAGAGRTIELVPEERLVKEGYILPVNVYLVGVRHKPTKYKRYQTIYKHSVVQNKKRNQKIAEVAARYSDCQTIILVKEIKHGQILANMTGYPFIHGSSKDRKELLEAFKEGRVSCLIATSILKQGIDIPEAEVLILAHGGAGEVELIQKIGRVRRPASGKRNGLVIDFRDQGIDVLERQFEKRLAIYQKRKYLIMNTVRPERSASNRCIQSS